MKKLVWIIVLLLGFSGISHAAEVVIEVFTADVYKYKASICLTVTN